MFDRNEARTRIAVLGAGLSGSATALELAHGGHPVTLIDSAPRPMMGASRHNEGKLHYGYVYAADERLDTHRILARGSLGFLDDLERLTGVPKARFTQTKPFAYIVPRDSARSIDDIAAYFNIVDKTIEDLCAEMGYSPLAKSRRAERTFCESNFSDLVEAAFHTPEIAVDPGLVSDIVAAAVYAHPLITFVGKHHVTGVDVDGTGDYCISLSGPGDDTRHVKATGVINALWEDRLRIDAQVGHSSPYSWSQRWKATVMIDVPPGSVHIPNTTGMVGPYGDFVQYGGGRIYVSWYPTCRLSMSTTATPQEVRAQVAMVDHEAIRTASLTEFASLIPGTLDMLAYKDSTRIGGGFIMAVGNSDIDKRSSGLHERHQVGVENHGTWISLSTGKYCTAPMFARQAARAMTEALA